MSCTIDKEAFQNLINGDLEWLMKQPRTLERDHIESLLKQAPMCLYEAYKLKKLAMNMYQAAQYLSTDASSLHKAMEEFHNFIVYEKEE